MIANHEPSTNNQPTTTRPRSGPNTDEGKKRVSLNALKHGLTARSPQALAALEERSADRFQPILDNVLAYYAPMDPIEEALVNRIARCLWRLARAAEMEARSLESYPAPSRPGHSNESIVKYERMVDLQLHRAMRALQRKRARK